MSDNRASNEQPPPLPQRNAPSATAPVEQAARGAHPTSEGGEIVYLNVVDQKAADRAGAKGAVSARAESNPLDAGAQADPQPPEYDCPRGASWVVAHFWLADGEGWACHPGFRAKQNALLNEVIRLATPLLNQRRIGVVVLPEGAAGAAAARPGRASSAAGVNPVLNGVLFGEHVVDENCPDKKARQRNPTCLRLVLLPRAPYEDEQEQILRALREVPLTRRGESPELCVPLTVDLHRRKPARRVVAPPRADALPAPGVNRVARLERQTTGGRQFAGWFVGGVSLVLVCLAAVLLAAVLILYLPPLAPYLSWLAPGDGADNPNVPTSPEQTNNVGPAPIHPKSPVDPVTPTPALVEPASLPPDKKIEELLVDWLRPTPEPGRDPVAECFRLLSQEGIAPAELETSDHPDARFVRLLPAKSQWPPSKPNSLSANSLSRNAPPEVVAQQMAAALKRVAAEVGRDLPPRRDPSPPADDDLARQAEQHMASLRRYGEWLRTQKLPRDALDKAPPAKARSRALPFAPALVAENRWKVDVADTMARHLKDWGCGAVQLEDARTRPDLVFHVYFAFLSQEGFPSEEMKLVSNHRSFVKRLPKENAFSASDGEPALRERLIDILRRFQPNAREASDLGTVLADARGALRYDDWLRQLSVGEREDVDCDPSQRRLRDFVQRMK